MADIDKTVTGLKEVETWLDLAGLDGLKRRVHSGLKLIRAKAKGQWIDRSDADGESWECSVCQYQWDFESPEKEEFYYCPHCGTRLGW